MADENQELQAQMASLRASFQGLEDEAKKSQSGLKAFNKATVDGAKEVTKGLGNFAVQVGKGDTSFKSLNTIVDITTNALGGMAKAIPFAGEAINASLRAAAEGAKFMLEQMDQTTKAFNDLGTVGALTAKGMSGLQQQFVQSGLTMNSFTKIVGQNSVAMARFRGITGDGAEEFTKITGALTQGDLSLRRIGMSAEQIGESSAAFVTQQTRLGRSQSMTTAELVAGSKQYALELDLLSKATGLSREAIQKQQDAALSESRFRANYEELMSQGREREAKALMTLQTRMDTFGKTMGQGTRDLISGAADTEAAVVLMNRTGGAAADIIARLKAGQIDQDQAQRELQAAMAQNRDAIMQTSKFVQASNSAYGESAEVFDFLNTDLSKGFEKAKKTQAAQVAGQDTLTENTVTAQQSMEKMNREIQQLGFTFLPKASMAVNQMTAAMKKFVEWVNKTISEPEAVEEIPVDQMGMPIGAVGAGPATLTAAEQKKFGVTATGAPVAGPAVAGGTATSRDDLIKMGLKIKEGDVQKEGGQLSPALLNLAKSVQAGVPGFNYFSGFNDNHVRDSRSKHPTGQALDFALSYKPSVEEGREIVNMLKSMGASYVQDEYNFPSSRASGGHIHAEVSAASGAILSGPSSGYRPNLTMHGTEAIVPLNSGRAQQALGQDPSLMMAQLDKMDEMVSVLKNQLSVSQKLLQYSA